MGAIAWPFCPHLHVSRTTLFRRAALVPQILAGGDHIDFIRGHRPCTVEAALLPKLCTADGGFMDVPFLFMGPIYFHLAIPVF